MVPPASSFGTTSAAPLTAASSPGGDDRLEARRRERLVTLPMMAASYVLDAVLLAGYAAVGVAPWSMPFAYLIAGLGLTAIFLRIFQGRWPERLRDHHMVIEQMTAHCALLVAFALATPSVGVPLMMVTFVVFAFGSLRMKYRLTVAAAVGIALAMALALAVLGEDIALPFASPAERALSSVWFMAVLARIAYLGQYAGRLRNLLNEQRAQLATALDEVERLASRDDLTGTLNRRAIMRLVGEERERMQRTSQPFAVALFDVDLFKRVNDEHGHLVGDEVLRRFSDAAAGAIRAIDRIGRFGGEEFLVLMPATGVEDAAVAAAERIRAALNRVDWSSLDSRLGVTVSAGVAVARAGDTVEALIGRADLALYAAKREGRDCVRAG